MRKQLAIAGITAAGLVGGGAAGFALTGTSPLAGAERTAAATAATDDTATTTAPGSSSGTDDGRPDGTDRPDPATRLGEALSPLVEDGTLTQAQADKVIEALQAAGPIGGGHGPGGRHGGPGLDAAATALGLSADELRAELRNGTSIADVAKDRGVEVSAVVDAMVADLKSHVAQEVTDGRITQEQADQKLADATERITAMVNGEMPAGGPGDGHGPGRGAMPQGNAPTTSEG